MTRAAKIGIVGPPWSGVTLTAMLIAIGLSKTRHASAPIAFVDPDGVSDFLQGPCAAESISLLPSRSPVFLEMINALHAAEAAECGVFVIDNYFAMRAELEAALRERLGLQGQRFTAAQRATVDTLWAEWTRALRSSPLDVVVSGHAPHTWTEDGADGAEDRAVADAADLLIDMTAHVKRTGTAKHGRMRYRALVLKDRAMALNGSAFTWPSITTYHASDYEKIYQAIAPHLAALTAAGESRLLRGESAPRGSGSLITAPAGESAYAERQRRATICIEEIQASLNFIWPGQTNEEKALRALVLSTMFGSRSWTAIAGLPLETLSTAWTVIERFEQSASAIDVRDKAAVSTLLEASTAAILAESDGEEQKRLAAGWEQEKAAILAGSREQA